MLLIRPSAPAMRIWTLFFWDQCCTLTTQSQLHRTLMVFHFVMLSLQNSLSCFPSVFHSTCFSVFSMLLSNQCIILLVDFYISFTKRCKYVHFSHCYFCLSFQRCLFFPHFIFLCHFYPFVCRRSYVACNSCFSFVIQFFKTFQTPTSFSSICKQSLVT